VFIKHASSPPRPPVKIGAIASGTGRMPCRRRGRKPMVSASLSSAFFAT
jgi:hypothetical protein